MGHWYMNCLLSLSMITFSLSVEHSENTASTSSLWPSALEMHSRVPPVQPGAFSLGAHVSCLTLDRILRAFISILPAFSQCVWGVYLPPILAPHMVLPSCRLCRLMLESPTPGHEGILNSSLFTRGPQPEDNIPIATLLIIGNAKPAPTHSLGSTRMASEETAPCSRGMLLRDLLFPGQIYHFVPTLMSLPHSHSRDWFIILPVLVTLDMNQSFNIFLLQP